MKTRLLSITALTCLAAAASAQVKLQTLPKNPIGGPVPNQPGMSFLLAGGSDDCANASANDAIVGPGTYAVTTVGATASTQAPSCHSTNLDVWFYYTATSTGRATVALCGSTTADTVLAAWDANNGTACPTGTNIACNDDSCGLQSSVTFCVIAGQNYFLQVGAYGATTTYTGSIAVTETPITEVGNDACSTPLALPAGDTVQAFDNTAMTTGCQGQFEPLCLNISSTSMYKDSWYTWTPTKSGTVTVSTCGLLTVPPGTTTDSRIAVYEGTGCPTAAALACNDDAGATLCSAQTLASTITFSAVCGHTYTIQVAQYSGVATTNLVGSFSVTEDPAGTPCTTPPTAFCFGDGTLTDHTTPCPCGNNGAAGNGCANSANANGANLAVTGSVALDNVVLNGSGMPLTVSCIYLQGTATDDVVFGDGVRCTGGSLLRLRTKSNVGGASSFPDSVETITLSQRGGVTIGSGVTRYYQTYYRNSAAAFCPPETFNVTNGMVIIW
ncbi:MAG: hypothetical protein U1F29_14900 [Planctomycetota bacterium]